MRQLQIKHGRLGQRNYTLPGHVQKTVRTSIPVYMTDVDTITVQCGLTVEVSPNMRAAGELFLHDIVIDLLVLQGSHVQHLLLSWWLAACCVDATTYSGGVGWNV